MASRLNLLQLGDEEAHYLGVNVRALQRLLLLCSALLVASAVAISGIIGFIGLVVPHLMRMWLGRTTAAWSPVRYCAAQCCCCWPTRWRATVAAPAEMPVGLLTSVLGAPWFLWLIFRREKGGSWITAIARVRFRCVWVTGRLFMMFRSSFAAAR
ncbi:Hemin ABC transporter [Klebsiella oxytoca]|nr:Hemin ABC transporter [Klebsiella oxytoca]